MTPGGQGKRMAFVNLFLANKAKGLRMGTDSKFWQYQGARH